MTQINALSADWGYFLCITVSQQMVAVANSPENEFSGGQNEATAKRWLKYILIFWVGVPAIIWTISVALLIANLFGYALSAGNVENILIYSIVFMFFPLMWIPIFGYIIYFNIKKNGITNKNRGFAIGSMLPMAIVEIFLILPSIEAAFITAPDAGQGLGIVVFFLFICLPIVALLAGGIGASLSRQR